MAPPRKAAAGAREADRSLDVIDSGPLVGDFRLDAERAEIVADEQRGVKP